MLAKARGRDDAAHMVVSDPVISQSFQRAMSPVCYEIPVCNPQDPYRTADGSCNNLFNPILGKAFTPQSRILPNAYDNCKSDCSQKFNSNLKNSLKKAHSLWKHQKIVLVKCVFLQVISLVRNLVDQVGEFFSLRDQFFRKKIQNVGGKILINGN